MTFSKQKIIAVCFLIFFLSTLPTAFCAAPELLEPADNARFGDENSIVVLEWEDTGADSYEIALAIDEEFEIGTDPIDCEDSNFFNITDFLGDDYWFPMTLSLYWRVRAVPASGVPGEWSQHRVIHKSTFGQTAIIEGKDGRYSPSTDLPRMSWDDSSSAVKYELEFASDEEFELPFGTILVTNPELDFSNIDRKAWDPVEGVFYWRVSTMVESDVPGYIVPGPWSDVCRLSKTLIDAPEITGPEDGTVYPPVSDQPVLTWNFPGSNNQYDLRFIVMLLDEERELTEISVDLFYVGDNTYSFETDLGIDDITWQYAPLCMYWSVAAYDSKNRPGPFSERREMIKPGYHRVASYGDSITDGEHLPDGYNSILVNMLKTGWNDEKANMTNIAKPGMKSRWGEEHIENRLKGSVPQYVTIMFGTNDSVDPGNCRPKFECDVAEHLAEMVTIARNRGSIPVVATIIPVNPDGHLAGAQGDVDENNLTIISMANQMNVELVDLNAMFWAHGNIPELFGDWGHPNEAGYQIMASGFYEGIMNATY